MLENTGQIDNTEKKLEFVKSKKLFFCTVIFSNVAVLFSFNFKPSYSFLSLLDLTQNAFKCQVDVYWHSGRLDGYWTLYPRGQNTPIKK